MTKLELEKIIEKSYLTLQKLNNEPLRNYSDATKFGTVVQNEINTLTSTLNTLRSDHVEYKRQFTWDNKTSAEQQNDIDNLTIALNALKGVISWLTAATIHKTLQSFEALSYPREQVNLVLSLDYKKIVSWDFWLKQMRANTTKIENTSDLLKFWIPFLNSPTNSDMVFTAIFGYSNPGNTDDKLLMRQIEILEKTDHPGLTRAERIEYEANGFTRSNVTEFMATLQDKYLSESDETFKELLTDYYNQLSNNEQVRTHLNII
jgi:hypothetical protein